ncbi:methyltransferase [Acidothermaceae bacterium B102]|nr:methyltransferase [Acidothermaceae bacterium B102]
MPSQSPVPIPPDDLRLLRQALLAAGYTVDGVPTAMSDQAHAALGAGDPAPALRATRDGSPLSTLIRLFLLGRVVAEPACTAALAPLPVASALAMGLLTRQEGGLRALLDVRPYGEPGAGWFVVSDMGGRSGPVSRDHVLGVGGASVTLAQATVRSPVGTALDLGTGSGVQALHLSDHAAAVAATDRNPRALHLAAMTGALSGVRGWELLEGDLFAPVAGRRFDLVVSNPPFVVAPEGRFLYRDSGLPGDEVCRRIVAEVPGYLNPGGTAQLLANWLHVRGADWESRLDGWLSGTGCDALVVQRELQDPAEYAALWLRDSGDDHDPEGDLYASLYDDWLAWFALHRVEAIGFGVISLRNNGSDRPVVSLENHMQPVEQPIGPTLGSWLTRAATLRDLSDDDLLHTPLAVADDVRLEQRAVPGDGWEVVAQTMLQESGLRRRAGIDEFGLMLVAGCTGAQTLAGLLDVLATAYDVDADDLRDDTLPLVRELVRDGYLLLP